jgi:hypothetical protein
MMSRRCVFGEAVLPMAGSGRVEGVENFEVGIVKWRASRRRRPLVSQTLPIELVRFRSQSHMPEIVNIGSSNA